MSRILVCYFSASGVTKKVAERIIEAVNGDIFEIEPQVKYTTEDLDWNNKQSRASIEMSDKSSRPAIVKKVDNIDTYNTIVIGFPVWWYTAPTIINTFIEENELKDKKIYIFVTSGGSSQAGSFKDLKEQYPNLNFISAKRFNGNEDIEEYMEWVK